MEYRLMCSGRLIGGTDETEAIARLEKVTGLSETDIRTKLLSGKRAKLKSSTDRSRIEALYNAFIRLGLDVEVESSAVPTRRARRSAERASSHSIRRRWLVLSASTLLISILGAGGYLWYWLRAPLPAKVYAAEAALADGHLVAIAHADVGRLTQLSRYAFGGMDPRVLPVGGEDRDILHALFTGPVNLGEHLDQLFVTVHAPAESSRAVTTMLLFGRFDKQVVLDSLKRFYRVGDAANGAWYELQPKKTMAETPCPSDEPKQDPQSPMYLSVDTRTAMLVNDRAYGARLLRRLQGGAQAAQGMTQWERYREGRLASLMVMSIPDAARSLSEIEGVTAQRAASEHKEVTGVAAGLEADLIARGLNVNLELFSTDTDWKRNTAIKIRNEIAALQKDARRVTPSLAGLLSRVQASGQTDALAIDVTLDRSVAENIGRVTEEAMSSVLQMEMPTGQQKEPIAEQIQTAPKDYAANAAFAALPALELRPHGTKPLFRKGAFGVNLEGVRMNDAGLLELRVQGRVALPKSSSAGSARTGELVLSVDSVTNRSGVDLMRDERCIKASEFYGRSRNHEPEISSALFQNFGQVTKHVRLGKDVGVKDIHRIKGRLRFSAPVTVRKFALPLQAGERIETGGMHFYLSSIGDNSVTYRVSGSSERLVEVRALNSEDKPLRRSWRVSGEDDGWVTQNYFGRIQALEVFVAEEAVNHEVVFQLSDLFTPREKADDPSRAAFAPERVDPETWRAYERLDMRGLAVDQDLWHVVGNNKSPVAAEHWAGVSMYLTHTPNRPGNSPQAHVYFPMLPELPGVLSAFSYHIHEPAADDGPVSQYARVFYPYRIPSLELVVHHRLAGRPVALGNWSLRSGLKESQRLDRLAGKLVFRLPTKTASTELALKQLWQGKTVDDVTVTLTEVGRGMFPGYAMKIEGDIARLVNLHGIDGKGERVAADPINYQQDGYWTMTLPFGRGIESVELVLATKQEVMEFPFFLRPKYPQP